MTMHKSFLFLFHFIQSVEENSFKIRNFINRWHSKAGLVWNSAEDFTSALQWWHVPDDARLLGLRCEKNAFKVFLFFYLSFLLKLFSSEYYNFRSQHLKPSFRKSLNKFQLYLFLKPQFDYFVLVWEQASTAANTIGFKSH